MKSTYVKEWKWSTQGREIKWKRKKKADDETRQMVGQGRKVSHANANRNR